MDDVTKREERNFLWEREKSWWIFDIVERVFGFVVMHHVQCACVNECVRVSMYVSVCVWQKARDETSLFQINVIRNNNKWYSSVEA